MKKLLYILIFIPLFVYGQEDDPCYSVNDFMSQTEGENSSITKNFVGGWNMFGYPCSQEIDVVDAFSSITDKVLIVKSNNGSVYMPEFGFNGIGFLEGGEGYQIKMANTEYGFSFCEPITWPNLEGCTDCEASNFNQWANVDDGSCSYDSDGDGVPDSEEVVGCQDSLACNYDETATDSGECSYAQEGYDCEGNYLIFVGAEAHGGIVFYYDSIGDYGLVAALEDLEGTYEWGCYEESVDGADGTSIGTGYQNTMDIVNQGCSTQNVGITAAQAAIDPEINDYNDWYLPSKDELVEIYNTIGNGGSEVNIGGFESDYYWSSSHYNISNSWYVDLLFGNTIINGKNSTRRVRQIRAFGNWTMGCMDSLACNYNPEANMSDGSCEYADLGYDCEGNVIAQIGDIIEGGYLFYLDETGARGLVAAMEDLSGVYQWGCYQESVDGADGIAIGTGFQNTLDVSAQNCQPQNEGITAAQATINFESQGYLDWYLPSFGELNEMAESITTFDLVDFNISESQWYWSSSESEDDNANGVILTNGTNTNFAKYNSNLVRAIRSFGNWTMGCMDETACNFNPEANMSNNSCEYSEQGYDCNGNITAEIGDIMEGGYLFYIDETGQHGKVADIQDLGQMNWNNATDNSESSISQDFNDWYLPNFEELNLMYNTLGQGASNIGGFSDFWYWSSKVHHYGGEAFYVDFSDGYTSYNSFSLQLRVRPIRSF